MAAAAGVSLGALLAFARLLRLHVAAEVRSVQEKLSVRLRCATAGAIAFAAFAVVYFIFF